MTAKRVTTTARVALIVAALFVIGTSVAGAQGGGRRNGGFQQYFGSPDEFYTPPEWTGNPVYDGRVTFVRLKYRGFEHWSGGVRGGAGWAHDYPLAESHFARIMLAISTMRPFVEAPPVFGSTILALDDPMLMKYPVAWLSEPGGWHMTPSEVAGFRKYITKGGFIIFDDMGCCTPPNVDLANLVVEWKKAFPDAKLMDLPTTHPVFDSFFKIDFSKAKGYYGRIELYAFYEDNDPKKRILAVVNNNQDLGDWMEWSDTGFNVTPANEAYKLAVNYFVYALTH
jgi:Domain of unknown function (DUF4159)